MATHANTPPHQQAGKTSPQYKADDGPLSATQLRQIKKRVRQDKKHSPRSGLLDRERAGK